MARYARGMEQQDLVLSEYVRVRLRALIASGVEQQEIATRAGLSKGLITAHLRTSGVGTKAAKGYAKVFGFRDHNELRAAARAWKGEPQRAVPLTSAQTEAMGVVVGLGQVTELQARAILAELSIPRFRDRDAAWWITTLLVEAARDRAGAPAAAPPEATANQQVRARKGER